MTRLLLNNWTLVGSSNLIFSALIIDLSVLVIFTAWKMTSPRFTSNSLALIIEGKIEGLSQYHPFKKNESVNTGYDESKYTIETCGGIYDEGNKGEEEKDPDFPIEIKDSDVYTFAFEDNWPAYGDFDMNDLVIVMSGKKL